ncbi:MAG TPA: c-type cytochrome [Gemmatimonadales bacterium]|nr:c-type cytochrome [Gemmatimonadales bacterium]
MERSCHGWLSSIAAGILMLAPTALPAQGPAPLPLRAPADSEMGSDDVGRSIRRGQALMRATLESLPDHVGNRLRCVSCHPDDGRRANAMPWIGVYSRFPQYRPRSGGVDLLEDRINDCFRRSLNGRALDPASREMRDIVSYMAFLSRGIPVGATVEGQGLPKLAVTTGDTVAGAALFKTTCARCHGADGQGTAAATPLWGRHSFNIGAGMARVRTAASFIRYNMPFDTPRSLTDQQAFDVAQYITTRPRPDFPGKELDWPRGDPPPDVAYPTKAAPAGPR